MHTNLVKQMLKCRKKLDIPLKYATDKEQISKNIDKYIFTERKDENGNYEECYATVDEDKYEEYRENNELLIKLNNMKNFNTIKNCIVFFTVIAIISLVIGFLGIIGQ